MILLLTVLFAWELFVRYNLTYNEMGRYFDDEDVVVYHEQAIPFYGLFFATSVVGLIVMCRCTLRTIGTQRSK